MPGARLCRVGSPFNASELSEVDFEQSADVMYLAHIDHQPGKLLRTGHAIWQFVDVAFGSTIVAPTGVSAVATTPNVDAANGGNSYFPQPASYVVTAIDDETGQESRASIADDCTNDLTLKRNYNTVTWSAVAGTERYRVYKQENSSGFGWIGDTTALTFRDDNIVADLTDSPPVANDPFAGEGNKPSAVTLFEQRLLWGRTKNKPNGIWGSKSSSFENMDRSRPQRPDDSIAFALVAQRVNAVNQMVPITNLLALGSDGIFKVEGSDGGALDAAPSVRRQSGRGSGRLNPLVDDTIVFFKTAVGNEIRTIGFSFDVDGYKTNDITIFSPHFFEGFDIAWWAFAQQPRSIIYAGRSDGKILAFTWEAEQQVWGWTLLETDGFVYAGCVISESGEDRLYVGVRREVEGETRRYLERMATVRWSNIDDAICLDSAIRYSFATPQTRLVGLAHLEGRGVKAVVDGNVVTGLTVDGGEVTLPFAGRAVQVGLPFEALIETLPLALETGEGSNQGRKQQAAQAVLRLVNSRGLEAGPSDDKLFPIKPRSFEAWGEANRLLTGDYLADMAPDPNTEVVLVIRQQEPLPFTLTAAFLDPVVGG
ncbi:MAG: hypothetical protein ACRCYS_11830 [Beijerinckiaceae bacterium]